MNEFVKICDVLPYKHCRFLHNNVEYRIGCWSEDGQYLSTYFYNDAGTYCCMDWHCEDETLVEVIA